MSDLTTEQAADFQPREKLYHREFGLCSLELIDNDPDDAPYSHKVNWYDERPGYVDPKDLSRVPWPDPLQALRAVAAAERVRAEAAVAQNQLLRTAMAVAIGPLNVIQANASMIVRRFDEADVDPVECCKKIQQWRLKAHDGLMTALRQTVDADEAPQTEQDATANQDMVIGRGLAQVFSVKPKAPQTFMGVPIVIDETLPTGTISVTDPVSGRREVWRIISSTHPFPTCEERDE
ncbi:hypothetical protein CCAX7_54840 [Capsulimonas corticalis]|uniref:Uncharacterized protein n=1 Tax=Capsulimonas corticalis TaxID=2219043 RepID=A0A402D5S2_9BACT|nr:hypothetical protein [Capsulimonas corticalis]BDI33433.1 hypothetical protein CCAX7_54840 [Capsulimonas corticalis]